MMKPLIGITTGEILNLTQPWSPVTYGQSHTYSDAVIAGGGIPVLIPLVDTMDDLKQLYGHLDGILFAGGNDIDPHLYNQEQSPKTADVSIKRDQTEVALMNWALADGLPILAICRGAQLLNVVSGGSLYQDIPSELPEASNHELSTLQEDRQYIAHVLDITKDSKLADIIKSTTIAANSHHHQAIKDTAPNLQVTARSEDGVVEAVEVPAADFVLGIQCHPEALLLTEPKWKLVFEEFIKHCTAKP